MNHLLFKSIKILKDKVNVTFNKLTDTEGFTWDPGKPETNKPASNAMITAMQGFKADLTKRLKATAEQDADISVHGVSLKDNNGTLGVKVHYKRNLLDGSFVQNALMPMFFKYDGDVDELESDEGLKYLTKKEEQAAHDLCVATQDYFSQVTLPIQLHIDQLLEITEAVTVEEESEETEENPAVTTEDEIFPPDGTEVDNTKETTEAY